MIAPMRQLKIAIPVLLAATILLVVATLQRASEKRRWGGVAADAIAGYSIAQRTLQVDLLNARAGLLRNYDPVNADLNAARGTLSRLGALSMDAPNRAALSALMVKTARQERLVERFKSHNALLQNSLTRFAANDDRGLAAQNILSAWILKLTLDTSPATVAGARAALDDLPRAPRETTSAQLTSHARLLVDVLPRVDAILREIRGAGIERDIAALEGELGAGLLKRTARLRLLELATVVLLAFLIAAVAALVLLQRLQTRELEAQAANARLSAAIAMPLIGTGGGAFLPRVEDAVHRLALHIGAKRLQLMIPGIPNEPRFSWPASGRVNDWLVTFVRAADADDAWRADQVIVSRSRGSPSRLLAAAMAEAGVDELVLLRTTDPCNVVLAFEPEGPAVAQRRDHLAGARSAITAIAHGARRELLQRERERLERMLARARRMEAIGVVASGVAHNFNNITGAIRGFAERGRARTRKASAAREYFDEILGAAERTGDLVEELLGYAKQGGLGKRLIDLHDILAETLRLLRASARDDAAFRLWLPAPSCRVLGAASELQQVFINICKNAAHASGGEPVTIECARVQLTAHQRFSHGSLEPSCYCVTSVCDLGPGVSDHVRERMFDPFFTTKAAGTGLGLSTAWKIVQDHGGTIDVANLPGGARFSVWLPEANRTPGDGLLGAGAHVVVLAAPSELSAAETLLREAGCVTNALSLSTDTDIVCRAVAGSDAVLLAAREVRPVARLVRGIVNVIGDRPLLLATPSSPSFGCPRVINLSYPIDRGELWEVLESAKGCRGDHGPQPDGADEAGKGIDAP